MIYLLYFTLLIFSLEAQQQQVVPEWNCWYHTYESTTRVVNLLFSYNNLSPADVIISSTSSENHLVPEVLNGQQPDIFKTGYQAYVMSLKNALPFSWQLDGTRINVTEQDLTESQRCSVKYLGTCPLWIPSFCEDSVYCNGNESCFSVAIFGILTSRSFGSCSRPASGVDCGVTAQCNESQMACVSQLPPETPAPPPPTIYPSFQCWYYTGNETQMIVNLRLSYNNTSPTAVSRPLDSLNTITPVVYNGHQPTLFYSGFNQGAFIISDTLDMLHQDRIEWHLGEQTLTLTEQNITVATRCPTNAPTAAPTAAQSAAPTADTPDIAVVAPTVAPTAEPTHSPQCSSEGDDCSQYDSFCNGPTRCDVPSGLCVLINPAYVPCPRPLVASTQIICVEHLSICIASMNCTADSECNDGLLCNGKETCVNGTCVVQTNLTIEELCGGPNFICIEGTGCQSTDQPISSELLLILITGVTVFLIVAGGLVALYLNNKAKKNKRKAKGK